MIKYILSSFCLAFFLFPAFISFLERTRILDKPEGRKIHSLHTPSMGGIPMLISVFFAILLWSPEGFLENKLLFGAIFLMFSIGLRDDLVPLHHSMKMTSQFIPFSILIYWGNYELISFYEFSGGFVFPVVLSWVVTLFVYVVVTNSFNLIDGIDGLAGTISLIVISTYGTWFYVNSLEVIAFICFAFSGALIAFLFFNWEPSKIFMGDTGALILGLMATSMTILFINYNYSLDVSNANKITSGIGAAICVMIVPLTDTFRVFIIRIFSGKSPFSADTNHLHHLLIRTGLSHSMSVKILAGINLLFILLAFTGRNWPTPYLLVLAVSLSMIGVFFLVMYVNIKSKSQTQKATV